MNKFKLTLWFIKNNKTQFFVLSFLAFLAWQISRLFINY